MLLRRRRIAVTVIRVVCLLLLRLRLPRMVSSLSMTLRILSGRIVIVLRRLRVMLVLFGILLLLSVALLIAIRLLCRMMVVLIRLVISIVLRFWVLIR